MGGFRIIKLSIQGHRIKSHHCSFAPNLEDQVEQPAFCLSSQAWLPFHLYSTPAFLSESQSLYLTLISVPPGCCPMGTSVSLYQLSRALLLVDSFAGTNCPLACLDFLTLCFDANWISSCQMMPKTANSCLQPCFLHVSFYYGLGFLPVPAATSDTLETDFPREQIKFQVWWLSSAPFLCMQLH